MSFCPTKDIHSVYLDNELPEAYKAEYEAHVSKCPKCQKELETLKALRAILKEDSNITIPVRDSDNTNINISKIDKFDEKFKEESFNRLMVKMTYSKNIVKPEKEHSRKGLRISGFVAGAAAAAVFALVVPIGAGGGSVNPAVTSGSAATLASAQTVTPLTGATSVSSVATNANNVSFGRGKSVLVSGNIHETVLSSNIKANDISDLAKPVIESDILRPDIEENKGISIKITVPGMNNNAYTTEINLPQSVITGNY